MEDVFKCPRCNSSQTRFRIKTDDRFCYSCGNSWKIEEEDKEGEENLDG